MIALAAVGGATLFACETNPNASDNAGVGSGNKGDPCAEPGHQGCACTGAGTTAQCGKVVQQSGTYVTCEMGTATCNGSTWGACVGNHVVTQSVPGATLTTQGLTIQSVTGGCSDPCDPYCTQTSSDSTDVDASGLQPTDGGLSLVGTTVSPDGGVTATCRGLQCNVDYNCPGGGSTTLTGHVYDPAGVRPLYNAYVYVPLDPSAPLPAFGSGASCDTCAGASSLDAIAVAQTDDTGAFTLTDVPYGISFPLVVQVGKWRREVMVPAVTQCTTTPVDPANSRLPKNRTDGLNGKADMPHIGFASGKSDPFECLLLKIGIDPAEIDVPSNNPAIDYYVANGKDRYPGGAPAHTTLVNSTATLNNYDAVILPCEGSEDDANDAYTPNLATYTDGGGRLFTTHFGYAWLATPTAGTAANLSEFYGTAAWTQPFETSPPANYTTNDPMTAYIDTSFPKGVAYADWLQNVGATSTYGALTVSAPRHDATATLNGSQRWVYGWSSTADPSDIGSAAGGSPDMMMHMTFNTPVAAINQCGRVVFSDFHVSTSDLVNSAGSCTDDADCSSGNTCIAAQLGTCSQETCTTNANCGDAKLGCVGAVGGTCDVRTCTKNSDCNSNKCVAGSCECSGGSATTQHTQCGSGQTCNALTGVCSSTGAAAACFSSNTDCGKIRKCDNITKGVCTKSCVTSPDCGGTDQCVAGQCYSSCKKDSDCPGAGSSCNGYVGATCSFHADMFPYSCNQSAMSAQEAALEFMFFDLAACVSNDKFVPPPPPQPVTYYYTASFTQQFTASCPAGQSPRWREVDWQATIPSTASINFSGQTGPDFANLNPATPLSIVTTTTTTSLPNFDVAYIDLADKGGGGAFDKANPAVASNTVFQLTITLNPTSDQLSTPSLGAWKIRYDCVDSQ